ncbi:hypothetical protein ACS0TY_018506 [Phlomoides rotata]
MKFQYESPILWMGWCFFFFFYIVVSIANLDLPLTSIEMESVRCCFGGQITEEEVESLNKSALERFKKCS